MFNQLIKKVVKIVIQEYGAAAMKSFSTAYREVINKSRANRSPFNDFYQNMEQKMTQDSDGIMTRTEALKILSYKDAEFPTPNEIGVRCYDLFQKNEPKNGGSVYIQAKILNAKDFLIK